MTLKIPSSIGGKDSKKAYEKIVNAIPEQEITKLDSSTNIEPTSFNLDIVKSDYIQIPSQNFVVAIAETNKNLNYEQAHKTTIKQGLMIPTSTQFMTFHNYIIGAEKNNLIIFDASGNPINNKSRKELYNQLTSDCWTWLNEKFNISSNKNSIEYITGLNSKDELIIQTEDLENCLMENCYIDFSKLTKQGLANINAIHSKQEFSKSENIYFGHPRNGRVGGFVADSVSAYLICDRSPSNEYGNLGVRAVKLAGGKK